MTDTVVLTPSQLAELVEVVSGAEAFCFDVETRGDVTEHPDLMKVMEEELAEHCAGLKNQSEAMLAKARERYIDEYNKLIAVDPVRNDLFWIGIAIEGRSWAIPLGHPLGEIIEPEEVGDGSTVPPPGYRKVLKSGKESMAKARYVKPAVYGEVPAQLSRDEVLEALRPLFFSDRVKIGHNVKFDARTVGRYYGQVPPGPYCDTMLLQHYLDENLHSYGLEAVIAHQFDGAKPYEAEGKVGKIISQVPFDVAARYLLLDVGWTWKLFTKMSPEVSQQFLDSFVTEMSVLRVLMVMEDNGITVDFEAMEAMGEELSEELGRIRSEITSHCGDAFNPDSTPDKARFLFGSFDEGGLGLTPVKTTPKGAPSTDKTSLEQIVDQHPVVPLILEWQQATKMKGTYVDGLLPRLNNGKLHCQFNLHRTATGRLSASQPNLQNIPARGPLGKAIRAMFVADEDHELIVADYNQIELRVFAMLSQDPEMIRIFAQGIDIHTGTAALVFNKPVAEVTDDERSIGKTTNFLQAYGGGAAKLAAGTGITEAAAREIIEGYYERFAGLARWKRKVVRQAREVGYVTTLSGRKRRLPELYWKDREARSRAERQAVNAVVQGTASDICKRAMIEVDRLIEGTGAKLLVQVHDELVMMAPQGDTDFYGNLLVKGMGDGTVIGGVPLNAEYKAAHSWAEAK